jgi:hypothetical protein
VKSSKSSSDSKTGETRFGDRAVNNPLLAEAIEQALRDLVSADRISSVFAGAKTASPRPGTSLYNISQTDPTCINKAPIGEQKATYAPLYCATSSPSTKTLSFCSISSAIASFSASRTVISLVPLAYPLLLAIDGKTAVARNAGRRAGVGRDADSTRDAGRKNLEAIAVASEAIEFEERGDPG